MIFGDTGERHGRHLKQVRLPEGAELLEFGAGWDGFSVPDDRTLAAMSVKDMAEREGVDPDRFAAGLAVTLRTWRVSPSRSFLNVLGNVGGGSRVFGTLRQQTTALLALAQAGLLDGTRAGGMCALLGVDGKRMMVAADAPAIMLADDARPGFDAVVRALALFEARTGALVRTGAVRPPKALYRGIRENTLPPVDHGTGKDDPYQVRSCRTIAGRKERLLSRPLAENCKSAIVSFTSNRAVAEYFTREEGFVVEVDPAEVGLVAGWSTEEGLDGKDDVSGRHEREWIVRLPADLVPSEDQVDIHDRIWSMSMGRPEGIGMLHHNDVAEYDLEGRHVRAYWVYKASGVGGSLRFQVADGENRYGTRAEIKRGGFDPLPGPDRFAGVENLRFYSSDPILGHRKDYLVLNEADYLEAQGAGNAPAL